MIYNNVEYLSLPQQVEKNKDDITKLKTDTAKALYGDTDVLPTPGIGQSHTYIVVTDLATDEGLLGFSVGGVNLTNPSIVIVSNPDDTFIVYSNPSQAGVIVPNLTVSTNYIKLLRIL